MKVYGQKYGIQVWSEIRGPSLAESFGAVLVAESCEIPEGYGFGWLDPSRDVAYCFRVPLNVVARWTRRAYRKLALPPRGYRFCESCHGEGWVGVPLPVPPPEPPHP